MSDTTQTTDFDSTIRLLQQDLASLDLVVAIALIERWERQLQGTALFGNLSELKQAILDGNTTDAAKLLNHLSEGTSAMAASVADESAAAKITELGRVLAQASNALK
jgi:hypothetical protein